MSLRYTIINIGTLSRNRFWGESQVKRASHATTTLIRDGSTTILVDPSLPAELLEQRLDERAGLRLAQIEVVFLTTFRPVHRRGLEALAHASWLMHEAEIEAMHSHLLEVQERFTMQDASETTDAGEVARVVAGELQLLARIKPAADKLTASVHLFPLAGASPGSAGLLLANPLRTTLIVGDTVLTRDHAEAGQVFEQSFDVQRAQDALCEVLEIADEIVPGHDNAFASAVR